MGVGWHPLKIVVLAKGLAPDPGGIEEYSFQVARTWSSLGHEVTVITQGSERIPGRTGDVFVRNVGAGAQWIVFLKMVLQVAKNTASQRTPVVFHATTWRMILPTLVCFPGSTIVLTVHGNEFLKKGRLLGILMKFCVRRADMILAVSEFTKAQFLNRFPGLDCSVRYNGVSSPDKLPSTSREPTLIFTVCRHERRKNLLLAIEAVSVLINKGIDVRYVIAGEGPETQRLQNAIGASSDEVQSRIQLVGRISEEQKYDYFARSSMFLHPQIIDPETGDVEGFGLAVAEAMSRGSVPVVGNNGGTKEVVDDGANGLLVNPGDREDIAEKVEYLLGHPRELRKMSELAIDKVATSFSWVEHLSGLIPLSEKDMPHSA